MENIKIEDDDGNLILDFDGKEWKIFTDYDFDDPETLDHEMVLESPFFLFQKLEQAGNAKKHLKELSKKSPELKKMIGDFLAEEKRLEKRIVLFEEYGAGMLDVFTDFLTLSGNQRDGFVVETTIEDNSDSEEYGARNALGEIIVGTSEKIFDAEQLYKAIILVTSDHYDRWENIDWTWEEIVRNLEIDKPRLANQLRMLVGLEEGNFK